jgi:hypothetical protein
LGVPHIANVGEDGDSGPSLCEDSLAVGVSLDKSDSCEASPFRGKVKPSDSREK